MKILSTVTVVLGAAVAALAELPYSWAHVAALAVGAGISGLHLNNTVNSSATSPKGQS